MLTSHHTPTDNMVKATTTDEWLEECLEENNKSEMKYCEHKEKKLRSASKPHSTPLTLKWLEENYELAEGVCIPRSTLYVHYLDFCEKNDCQPVNAASFGKIIRQQFQHITTRRLGTRGQSKYHYYGIGIKEASIYYELMFSKNGVQSSPGDTRKDPLRPPMAYSPRSKLGTLLPEFPDAKDLKLPANIAEDKVSTFVMMYRTHCQRILDTVIRANFDEVQNFLLHFWQGMPQHIVPILGTPTIVSLVGVCDAILYRALAGVLMPTVLQALPDSLTQVIRRFGRQLDEWLRVAMEGLPHTLTSIKLDLAHRFSQVLRRQTSLNHLCQAARTVIHSSDILAQMVEDWRNVDLGSICKQTLYTMDHYRDWEHAMIIGLYKEFEQLLEDQAPLEAYTEWLDSMVQRCVVTPSLRRPGTLRRVARQFLLMWSCFGTRIIRDMTLHSAPSFGSFHLLHLMFDDYVLYMVESLHSQERARELLQSIRGEHTETSDDDILPRPSLPCMGATYPSTASRHTVITDVREATAYANAMQGTYGPSQHTPQASSTMMPGGSSESATSPAQSSVTSFELQQQQGGVHTVEDIGERLAGHAVTSPDAGGQGTCYGGEMSNEGGARYSLGHAHTPSHAPSAAMSGRSEQDPTAAAAAYGCYPYSQTQYNSMSRNYASASSNNRYNTTTNADWDYTAMSAACSQQQQQHQQQQHQQQHYDGYQRSMSYASTYHSHNAYDASEALRNSSQQGFLYPQFDSSTGFFTFDNNNMTMGGGAEANSRKRKSSVMDNGSAHKQSRLSATCDSVASSAYNHRHFDLAAASATASAEPASYQVS